MVPHTLSQALLVIERQRQQIERMSKDKTRRPGAGLQSQIEAFFRDNPDEELTINDCVHKFGCTRSLARATFSTLARLNRVEVVFRKVHQ